MAFTWSRVKPRYLMPPSQGGCIIWQPEREWGGTGEPWEREGSAAVEGGRAGRGQWWGWGWGTEKEGHTGHTTGSWEWEQLRTPSCRTQRRGLGLKLVRESTG